MQTPRLVYKGACDDTAQTKRVDTQEALDCALADGWRLRRRGLEPEPDPVVSSFTPEPTAVTLTDPEPPKAPKGTRRS